jgi:predicted RNA-binding Zn ribbon-like protein
VFDLDAGIVCLDFVNTFDLRSGEHLDGYADLVAFAEQSGLLTPPSVNRLRADGQRHAKGGEDVLARAKRLRAALRGIFSALAEGRAPSERDLAAFNRDLAISMRYAQVERVTSRAPQRANREAEAEAAQRVDQVAQRGESATQRGESVTQSSESAPQAANHITQDGDSARQRVEQAAEGGQTVAEHGIDAIAQDGGDAARQRGQAAPGGDVRFVWGWNAGRLRLDQPLWPIVHSAADLLTSDELRPLVRQCGAEDCRWLFLDTTKNRSRQWCSMTSCGNREKARRHYERVRAQRTTEASEPAAPGATARSTRRQRQARSAATAE